MLATSNATQESYTGSAPAPQSTADDSYALDEFRCREILHDVGWGVLSVVEAAAQDASPYSIPVAYAYDGEQIFVAVVSGRKQRALEAHGELCLTVLDVDVVHAAVRDLLAETAPAGIVMPAIVGATR